MKDWKLPFASMKTIVRLKQRDCELTCVVDKFYPKK